MQGINPKLYVSAIAQNIDNIGELQGSGIDQSGFLLSKR